MADEKYELGAPGWVESLAEAVFSSVKPQIDALKSSVSSGKALVAAAVTDKGVPTAADASFSVMAQNISHIPTGGGDTDAEDGIIMRTLSGAYENDRVTNIGVYAFNNCTALTNVSFPACTSIGNAAFNSCTTLTTVNFPACTTIVVAFPNCTALTTASFPACKSVWANAFRSCYRLISLYLLSSQVCSLIASTAFYSTPIGGYSTVAGQYGSIYVPASLLASYQAATNWTYFSSRFVGV